MKTINAGRVRLVFPRPLWEELLFIAKEVAPNEVSGLGEIEIVEPGRLRVKALHLLRQKASQADVELSPAQVAELQSQLCERDVSHQLKLWWHTHGDGQPFWSSQDEHTCEKLRLSGEWFASVVLNSKGEALGRVDSGGEFGSYAIEVGVVVESMLTPARREALRQEITETVEIVPLATESLTAEELQPVKRCGECDKITTVTGSIGSCRIHGDVKLDDLACSLWESVQRTSRGN